MGLLYILVHDLIRKIPLMNLDCGKCASPWLQPHLSPHQIIIRKQIFTGGNSITLLIFIHKQNMIGIAVVGAPGSSHIDECPGAHGAGSAGGDNEIIHKFTSSGSLNLCWLKKQLAQYQQRRVQPHRDRINGYKLSAHDGICKERHIQPQA